MNNPTRHLEWLALYPSLLVSGIASGAKKRMADLERENAIMRAALYKLACWNDGFEIDGTFDEPGAAFVARRALWQLEEIEE